MEALKPLLDLPRPTAAVTGSGMDRISGIRRRSSTKNSFFGSFASMLFCFSSCCILEDATVAASAAAVPSARHTTAAAGRGNCHRSSFLPSSNTTAQAVREIQLEQQQLLHSRRASKNRRSMRAVAPNPVPDDNHGGDGDEKGGDGDEKGDESSMGSSSVPESLSTAVSGGAFLGGALFPSDFRTDTSGRPLTLPISADQLESVRRAVASVIPVPREQYDGKTREGDESLPRSPPPEKRFGFLQQQRSQSFKGRRQNTVFPAGDNHEGDESSILSPGGLHLSAAPSQPSVAPLLLNNSSRRSSGAASGILSFLNHRSRPGSRRPSFSNIGRSNSFFLRIVTPTYPKFLPSPFQRSDNKKNKHGGVGSSEVSSRRSSPWILEQSIREAVAAAEKEAGGESDERSAPDFRNR
jgi:hypothetical protein